MNNHPEGLSDADLAVLRSLPRDFPDYPEGEAQRSDDLMIDRLHQRGLIERLPSVQSIEARRVNPKTRYGLSDFFGKTLLATLDRKERETAEAHSILRDLRILHKQFVIRELTADEFVKAAAKLCDRSNGLAALPGEGDAA